MLVTRKTQLVRTFLFSPFIPCTIAEFVKGDRKNNFPKLQVRYKKGANPILKLLDDTNTVEDTLA